ncbi:hypothetical protein [Amycolatopsis sp. FDAARGOS 1241]|uniref:hypothetical protein n=1 Tax=Amycolatopsis sp. FDAARGOS 1241 TaxID=2778070 RepID=UPI00194E2D3C|nr:hypothetical protein [Amycolatopsis sp. FDAARGOS 1241]QRP45154.1 hypothetical protein I6J71_39250 [Amycolatopsis sp. FDAARGOS 1241]
MRALTFAAWRDGRYVPLAELLVCLGGLGLDLRWQVQIDEAGPHPRYAELLETTPQARVGTLELLALAAPDLQVIDGTFTGWVGGEPVVILEAFDSTSWDVYSADERVLVEFRRRYPDARDMPR